MLETLSNRNFVLLTDFYPAARGIRIPRPENLFVPDEWTATLAAGLDRIDFKGSHVLEVGVGVGINMAGLLTIDKPPASFIGTDICENAVYASKTLAGQEGIAATLLKSDLLSDIADNHLTAIDCIFACIPQVPETDLDLNAGDNYAHYYRANGGKWDLYGLGLNEKLIRQATERAPQADLILNLSGRPGIGKLEELFKEAGRDSRILYTSVVPQHKETSLQSLAELEEEHGHPPFEFFADKATSEKISAAQAEERRLANDPVFHRIYVMQSPGLRR